MSPRPSTSAVTLCTAGSTDCTSPCPTSTDLASGPPAELPPAARRPSGGTAGDPGRRSRFAWAVTGSGHFLQESLELAFRLPEVDFFLSAAAEEVLPLYHYRIDALKERFRVFRDKTASSIPVGMLYDDVYHTVIVAPATSNTVA